MWGAGGVEGVRRRPTTGGEGDRAGYTALLVKTSVTDVSDDKLKISVEIDEQTFDKSLDSVYRKLAREVRIPGFRPGKAPRKVLERYVGTGYARGEALQEAIPRYYADALIENEIDAIDSPEIDITAGEEEGDVAFDAVVSIRPRLEISGYADLTVEIPLPMASDEDVEAQIDRIRSQFADLVDVDRPAREGDSVTIDIEGSTEDEPIPGLTADDYLYEVGTSGVGPELDENLIGASAGDVIEFEAPHPGDEDMIISYRVEVKAVREKVLPELTDEWVDENTEYDTVGELRADTRRRLDEMARNRASQALREGTAAALAELVEAEVPEALVNSEMSEQVQHLAYSLQAQGLTMEQWIDITGQSEEEFTEQLRESAERSARVDLALRAVGTAENLHPGPDDIEAELARIAQGLGEKAEVVRKRLTEADGLMSLRSDLLKRAALDWMVEHITPVDAETGEPIERSALEPPSEEPTGNPTDEETETASPTGSTSGSDDELPADSTLEEAAEMSEPVESDDSTPSEEGDK